MSWWSSHVAMAVGLFMSGGAEQGTISTLPLVETQTGKYVTIMGCTATIGLIWT